MICLGDFSDQLPLPALRSGRLQPFLGHRRPQKILPLSSARVLACGSSIVSEPSPHPIRESAQSKLGRGETKTYLCTAEANQQVNNIPRNARCCRTVDNDRRPCCLLSVFPRLCPLGLKLKPLRPHNVQLHPRPLPSSNPKRINYFWSILTSTRTCLEPSSFPSPGVSEWWSGCDRGARKRLFNGSHKPPSPWPAAENAPAGCTTPL